MTEKRKSTLKRLRFKKLKKAPPGSAPGIISVAADATKPVARITCYDDTLILNFTANSVGEIKNILNEHPGLSVWVEIKGFGDKQFYEDLAIAFNIHRLEMEDVLSSYQRPKIEEAEGHLFIISRPIFYNSDDEVSDDQLSIFMFQNLVISIQERPTDYFSMVHERLIQNKGILRKSGSSYMAYALMDAVVDNYFPFLEKLGNFLDDLEDNLLQAPDHYSLQNIQASKRRLILFRKIAWAEREKLNELLRTHTALFSDISRRYLRDTYDHTIQVMDIIDSYREITASLMDIYLSSVSNRLNQVMKFLTIISTIFIPLTFIVGLYGMNFVYNDAETGEKFPMNMPELHSAYGYPAVLFVMLVIVLLQIYYFYKKGWLSWKDRF